MSKRKTFAATVNVALTVIKWPAAAHASTADSQRDTGSVRLQTGPDTIRSIFVHRLS